MGLLKEKIRTSVEDGIQAVACLHSENNLFFIEHCAHMVCRCLQRGGKILIAGNGGSLCDAMHFAEELSGQFRGKRPALAALALSDVGHMSCVANDMGYDQVFSRGVEALGRSEDLFIALTTSGNSANLVEAVKAAKLKNIETISFLGKTGGVLKGMCDLELIIEGFAFSDRIQEAHMTAIHIIIEMVEELLFNSAHAQDELALHHVS